MTSLKRLTRSPDELAVMLAMMPLMPPIASSMPQKVPSRPRKMSRLRR